MKLYLSLLLRVAAAGSQKVPSDTTIYLCYNKQLQWIFTDLWVWIGLDDVNDRSPFPFQFLFRCRSIHRIAAGGFCFSGRILPMYVRVCNCTMTSFSTSSAQIVSFLVRSIWLLICYYVFLACSKGLTNFCLLRCLWRRRQGLAVRD